MEVPKTSSAGARQSQNWVNAADWAFKYPITFVPIPYFNDTKYGTFLNDIIPRALTTRQCLIDVPKVQHAEIDKNGLDNMDIDNLLDSDELLVPTEVNLRSDGILLYVAQASYEPGNSPLSNWIPVTNPMLTEGDNFNSQLPSAINTSPLSLFRR